MMVSLESHVPVSLETPVSQWGGLAPFIVITLECGHWLAVSGELLTFEGKCVHIGIPFCVGCAGVEP